MKRRLILVVVAAALTAAIVLMPLRFALALAIPDDGSITMRSASGTIWDGRVEDMRVGRTSWGALDVGLRPLPLLLGRAEFDVARMEGSPLGPLTGRLISGFGQRGVADLTGTIGISGGGRLPVESVRFDGLSAALSASGCDDASGRVQVMLGVRIAGLVLRNGLSGAIRCDSRRIVVPLAGESGMERLTLRIAGDGAYDAQLSVQASDPLLGAALSAAGFRPTAEGYVRNERGRF
jgi:general secretion pathway protein N